MLHAAQQAVDASRRRRLPAAATPRERGLVRQDAPVRSTPEDPAAGVAADGLPHDASNATVDFTIPSAPGAVGPSDVATRGRSAPDRRTRGHHAPGLPRPRPSRRSARASTGPARGDGDGCPSPSRRAPSRVLRNPTTIDLSRTACSRCRHRGPAGRHDGWPRPASGTVTDVRTTAEQSRPPPRRGVAPVLRPRKRRSSSADRTACDAVFRKSWTSR